MDFSVLVLFGWSYVQNKVPDATISVCENISANAEVYDHSCAFRSLQAAFEDPTIILIKGEPVGTRTISSGALGA